MEAMEELRNIIRTDLPDVEKLAQAFGLIVDRVVGYAQQDVELARAMQDRDRLVKEQVKLETIKTVRGIFEHCYLLVTRRSGDE